MVKKAKVAGIPSNKQNSVTSEMHENKNIVFALTSVINLIGILNFDYYPDLMDR